MPEIKEKPSQDSEGLRPKQNRDGSFFVSEAGLRAKGIRYIAGVDEVGRGPLAGPVVACACILSERCSTDGIRDSKVLSPKKRKELFWRIISHALIGIGMADEKEIDQLNIFHASLLAMKRAVLSLPRTPEFILIDGMHTLSLPLPQAAVIKGDTKLVSVSAASIVAKVVRDELMDRYDQTYPQYGFRDHKGYPTEKHLEALTQYGPLSIHRFSFGPVNIAAKGFKS